MKIDIITIFPEMFKGPFDESMIKRAQEKKLVEIKIHNLRRWAVDKHQTVDDRPFGGGKGMVLMIEPIAKALAELGKGSLPATSKKILLSPQGSAFTQEKARELAGLEHLILVAGHYEGFDERIGKHLVDEELSIGDYVLTGGELPAMVVVDTIVRLIPGTLTAEAIDRESFSPTKAGRLLDYPQYTQPVKYGNWKVPEILLSGHHAEIDKWRQAKALEKTRKNRPDLLKDSA